MLDFCNLELPHFRLQDMKIKPLSQLREMISKALSGQTNSSKSFQSCFIEAMELFLTIPNRSSDGEVRTLVRTAVPYELQEEVLLDIVQPDNGPGRYTPPPGDSHRPELYQ